MKKTIIVFLLIFSLSFFYGCKGSTVDLGGDYIAGSVNFCDNGQISQTLGISVNSKRIDGYAKSGESVQFKTNLAKELEGVRQKFLLNFAVIYLQWLPHNIICEHKNCLI